MRLPPSSTAWRMAESRRGSVPSSPSSADSSAASTRARQRARAGWAPLPPGSGLAIGQARERLRPFRGFGVGEQAHAQLGLLQRVPAAAVEAHAALVGGEGFLQAHVALFHLLYQLLELVERGLEIGDRRGVVVG